MKRCPKCSRTYPDDNQKFCTVDGGLLLSSEQAFDPNATVQISSSQLGTPPPQPPRDRSSQAHDPNATIAVPSSAETGTTPGKTGPAGRPGPAETRAERPTTALPPKATELPPKLQGTPSTGIPVVQPKKKSKLLLILGILLLLLVLGVGAIVALFFLVIKPRLNQIQAQADRPVV